MGYFSDMDIMLKESGLRPNTKRWSRAAFWQEVSDCRSLYHGFPRSGRPCAEICPD